MKGSVKGRNVWVGSECEVYCMWNTTCTYVQSMFLCMCVCVCVGGCGTAEGARRL